MKVVLPTLCLLSALLALNAPAQPTLWWDNNGTAIATDGTWDTTSSNWSTSSFLTASTVPFTNGDIVVFAAGTGTNNTAMTITLNTNITCAGLGIGDLGVGAGSMVSNLSISGSGTITLPVGTNTFYCGTANPYGITVNVNVTGAGQLKQSGGGYLTLYGSNTYTGGTVLTGGERIFYYQGNSFGTGPIIVTGNNSALVAGFTNVVTIPNNFFFPNTNTVMNLAGGNPVAGAPGTIYSGNFPLPASGTFTLQVGVSPVGLSAISGVISGASALNIADNGTLQLGGTNTYTGATSISNNSTLILVGSGSLGSGSYSANLTIISNTSSFIYNSSANQTLSGTISGAGVLVAAGPGTLTLNGMDSCTGATTVSNGGILALGPNGGIGNSTVTVLSNGILANLITSGANTLNSALTFAAGGGPAQVLFNGSGASIGRLAVNGSLILNSTAVTINVTGSPLAQGSYRLITCAGTVSGFAAATATITGLPLTNGYIATVSTTSGNAGHVDLLITIPPVFQMIAQSGTNLNFTWSSLADSNYQVQYKTNLLQTNWLNLGSPITATSSNLTTSDSITNSQRFYRVVLMP